MSWKRSLEQVLLSRDYVYREGIVSSVALFFVLGRSWFVGSVRGFCHCTQKNVRCSCAFIAHLFLWSILFLQAMCNGLNDNLRDSCFHACDVTFSSLDMLYPRLDHDPEVLVLVNDFRFG